MSRKSPSGPVAVTDQVYSVNFLLFTSIPPPGGYYAAGNIAFALVNGSFIPVGSIGAPALPLFLGAEASQGRLGTSRVSYTFDPSTTGSDPFKLQWTVNGVPVGNELTFQWNHLQDPTAGNITFDQALAVASGQAVDFGDVEWQAGDTVLLLVTFGTINPVSTGQGFIGVVYDKNYK